MGRISEYYATIADKVNAAEIAKYLWIKIRPKNYLGVMENLELSKKKCIPCSKETPPLKGKELKSFFKQLRGWKLVNDHHLEKEYLFKNFKDALAFTNKIGNLAEQEGHHPDILLSWGKVKIELWTHKINGLSESDFIMAAKCDLVS